MYNAIERVEAGVKFLNENYSAWAEEAATYGQTQWIDAFRYYDYHDIDKFNIDNSYTCILGRLIHWAGFPTENYFNMRSNLDLDYEQCKQLGFTTSVLETYGSTSQETRELNEAWIAKLDELLNKREEDKSMENLETLEIINKTIDLGVEFLNSTVNTWLKEHTDKTDWIDAFKNWDYYDVNVFDINNSTKCILGRIIKWSYNHSMNYFDFTDLLEIDYEYTESIGMAVPNSLVGVNMTLYAETLTEEWVKRLDKLTA